MSKPNKGVRIPGRRGIYRLGSGRYRLRAEFQDPKTKKRREIDQVVIAKSPAEAERLREQLLADAVTQAVAPPELPAPPIPTLAEYASSWLDTRLEAREFKPSTAKLIGYVIAEHIIPGLGALPLDRVRKADVLAWFERQSGAAETVNGRLRVLRTVLRSAVDRYELAKDPTAGVKPKRNTAQKRRKALTRDELEGVLAAVRTGSPKWFPLILTLARTGCRFGEATALHWDDIDRTNGTITIARAQWHGEVGTTKTGAVRVVAMTPDLLEVLDAHRAALMRAQDPGYAEGWVFSTHAKRGVRKGRKAFRLLQSSSLRKPLADAAKSAGLELHVHAHCLRHTANNLLRQHDRQGHVTRSQIGHSSAEMTGHYSHVEVDEQRALLRRAFPGAFAEASGENPGSEPESAATKGNGPVALPR